MATDGLRDGRVNNIGPLVFPNLSLYGPCEQCVYIRFAMFVMVFGGLIAAINPKNVVLKLIGCIVAFYGSIMGIKFSLKLNDIHHAVHKPGFAVWRPGVPPIRHSLSIAAGKLGSRVV